MEGKTEPKIMLNVIAIIFHFISATQVSADIILPLRLK